MQFEKEIKKKQRQVHPIKLSPEKKVYIYIKEGSQSDSCGGMVTASTSERRNVGLPKKEKEFLDIWLIY